MSAASVIRKFLVPSGIVTTDPIFNRSVWHDGDILRANMINHICINSGMLPAKAAGCAIQHVLYDQLGSECPKLELTSDRAK
jgi:hypothetical protein